MTKTRCALSFALALPVATAASLPAQDQFGRAVSVVDDDVLVVKPSAGRGPATVYVFRVSGGAWRIEERLRPMRGAETGEGFGPSIGVSGGTLLVASGDPNVQWGAEAFHRGTDGAWTQAGPLPLGPEREAAESSRDRPLDLPTLMRIVQPPGRVVAMDGDRAVVAVVTGPRGTEGAWIVERESGSDQWSSSARLQSLRAGSRDRFGAALALSGDRALVGAPRYGESGAVFVFGWDAGVGAWVEEDVIQADDMPAGSRFGAAVDLDGDVALIGSPGSGQAPGAVSFYSRNPVTGTWHERRRLRGTGENRGDRYGTAFDVAGDELWVGAPGADERRGRIHRFQRVGALWQAAGVLPTSGLEPLFGLGTAIALGEGVGVAGAPGADGGVGRAAVFTRPEQGQWGEAVWLEPGGDLERIAGEEVRCSDGEAAGFACHDVDLLAFLPIQALGGGPGERVSDLWGWTDPETGREYALVGRTGGTAFVDITDPPGPIYLGVLPANRSGARDIKVYRDHVFFTGDGAGDHGMLIFDLTRLRDVADPPVTFEPDARYDGIASAHNLVIDTESGFAYTVGNRSGGQTCGGGLHMVDIRDPTNPTFAGCYTDTEGLIWPGRTHDAQCVVYRGPDEKYRGRQICFASNETALRIVDVTDKENPDPLAAATYPGLSYVHQGWLTEDQRYFYLDDELDELVGQAERTRTVVWDVTDLDDPVVVGEYFGPSGATDHNLYIKGNRMYQANYQAGLRVVDISDPEHPVEVGFFDTTPYEGNPPGFNGAWTAFPFFESGTVIVSSMYEGLFVLKPRVQELVP